VPLNGPLLFRHVAFRPGFTSFDLPAEADLAFWFPVCTLACRQTIRTSPALLPHFDCGS
jgi:hypothetical protein